MNVFINSRRKPISLEMALKMLFRQSTKEIDISSTCDRLKVSLAYVDNNGKFINPFYASIIFLKSVDCEENSLMLLAELLSDMEEVVRDRNTTIAIGDMFHEVFCVPPQTMEEVMTERGYSFSKEPKYWFYDWLSCEGFFYIVKLGDMYKIGQTKNLTQRLASYRNTYPLAELMAHHMVKDRLYIEAQILAYLKEQGYAPIHGRREFFISFPPINQISFKLLELTGESPIDVISMSVLVTQFEETLEYINSLMLKPTRIWWFYLLSFLHHLGRNLNATYTDLCYHNLAALKVMSPDVDPEDMQSRTLSFVNSVMKGIDTLDRMLHVFIVAYAATTSEKDVKALNRMFQKGLRDFEEEWNILRLCNRLFVAADEVHKVAEEHDYMTMEEALKNIAQASFPEVDFNKVDQIGSVDYQYMGSCQQSAYTKEEFAAMPPKKSRAILAVMAMLLLGGNETVGQFVKTLPLRSCVCGKGITFFDCCQKEFESSPVFSVRSLVCLTDEGWVPKEHAEKEGLEELTLIDLRGTVYMRKPARFFKSKQLSITTDKRRFREAVVKYGGHPPKGFVA